MSSPRPRPFVQVDVFTDTTLRGNPLAVVVDGSGLDEACMQAFARWTNLSETTFLLPPTGVQADYRVRIFTPGGELPFAGHPTLGSCQAWLAHGGVPQQADEVVQECGVGLVRIRRDPLRPARLAFAAPALRRSGPADAAVREQVCRALRLAPDEVLRVQWVDNGPGWVAAWLKDAATVRALRPDWVAMSGLNVGVAGRWPAGAAVDLEVRAFVPGLGVPEDPVTGSLNAGLALWLIDEGLMPERYVAGQGHALGRDGRVQVQRIDGVTWIGGDVAPCIGGQVLL
ncbi:PhzF family phenazine biosynthesis protein [Sphaerotilus hippei]|uniref:PhzF family phenazine biosynthesis protein n=1 Tax=Sphaerotilus hippei TaxID=744406 RepID=A0A318GXM6_9BURK|nr:PhzF family phenazine biosynthesis protein [Sphaerotilus hippei]PXW94570.1 PhzF family phenazine biosynthesis protein [Sphaerotilus hippei]